MQQFADLITRMDATNSTNEKVQALTDYFAVAPESDKVWTIALLSHRRPRRSLRTNELRTWAAQEAGVPDWLFEESYHIVGDLSEAISLIVPGNKQGNSGTLTEHIELVKALKGLSEEERRARVTGKWRELDRTGRFIFNKLITGGFRIGVSQKLMVRALSRHTGVPEDQLAHQLMGDWDPATIPFHDLVHVEESAAAASRPYPFCLAHALDMPPADLGDPADWMAEHKWDGIRGQLIVRGGELYLWTRGEELVTDKYPELHVLRDALPDGTVLDGELLPWRDDHPLPFQVLQTRIGRTSVSARALKEAPVVFVAYDLLEQDGADQRERPMQERRKALEAIVEQAKQNRLRLSPEVRFATWEDLAEERERSREMHSEGIMLKRRESVYRVGRKRGDWWKWKVDPLSIDGVLLYAQRGHGRRADLFTDFTFAVWKGEELVPFAKAYSGLTDEEMRKVDAYVKQHTKEKFGPVRSVTPMHVFEIGFEGIGRSPRHKSGVALRFPRILRWRTDKDIRDANTLEDLQELLHAHGQGAR
ncbi:MAG: ATP-dependent DNA ligase [Flavobacteriales bacterium]|nr:ATP-dependent DNA ligase [Flavobacteriales bacterium]